VSWVALNQPSSVHGLCGKNAVCEYQPSLRCSCIPPPLEEAPTAASRRRGHGHAAAQVRPPAQETPFRPMSACFERIPGGSRVLVRLFTDRAWDCRGLRDLGRQYKEEVRREEDLGALRHQDSQCAAAQDAGSTARSPPQAGGPWFAVVQDAGSRLRRIGLNTWRRGREWRGDDHALLRP
jgi:hypothetical protein